jgi:hypothetical protein
MAYMRDAHDTRTVLKFEQMPALQPFFSIADDGTVWAIERNENPVARTTNWGGTIVRYDGKAWKPLAYQPENNVQAMLPGKGGVMLVQEQGSQDWVLYRGDQQIASGGLPELIEKNREIIQKSFGADAPVPTGNPGTYPIPSLVADKGGNVWRVDESGHLLVLIGDRWQPAREAMVGAGVNSNRNYQLRALGDGRVVYGYDRNGSTTKLANFFGEVVDGKLKMIDAPALINYNYSLGVRDAEGLLWAMAQVREENGSPRQYLVRLGPEGVQEKSDNHGTPRLCDANAGVWIEKPGSKPGEFRIWRGGAWGQDTTIPDYARNGVLFSDRPGSVYAWTGEGLQRMIAEKPDYTVYRPGPRYAVDKLPGDLQSLAYSRLGYAVISTQSPIAICLVKLPAE